MTWFNVILPIVTLILGYVGTLVTESRRDARQRQRDVEARAAARQQSLLDRRESFELVNLNECYSALTALARAASRYHVADVAAAKATGRDYGGSRLDKPELDDALLAATQASAAAANLVLIDDLRAKALAAHAAFTGLAYPPRPLAEAESRWSAAGFVMKDAQEALAHRIREIYVVGQPS